VKKANIKIKPLSKLQYVVRTATNVSKKK